MGPRTCGLLPAQGRALLSRPGVMPDATHHILSLLPWSATSEPVRLLKIDFTDGGLMLRIDDMVIYTYLHIFASFCGPLSLRHELGYLRRGSLPATAAAYACPVVQQGCRFSHLSPSFMTAMTRMIVGTCMCYCGTACHIPKGLVPACIRCTNCCMAADYCTEAQEDLPRVQRAGGLPRAGNLMRMRAPQSLGA